jgi:glycosyltransferase involved in cell wall biosynthesis
MIAKNEERNLQACLDSVCGLVDQVIVVDTGSTDSTPQIAARNGALVVPFDFRPFDLKCVDFSAARNEKLARATGDWILVLDADETLDRADFPFIKALIAGSQSAGYHFSRRNHSPDGHIATVDYPVRLFPRRPDYRYCGRVHETVNASICAQGGRLSTSGIRIDHRPCADRAAQRLKNLWYIGILKEELAANPNDASRLDFLAAEYHQLEMFEEATQVAECIAQVRPLDPGAHLNAGIYHMIFRPDLARARKDFSRALALKPGYQEAAAFLHTLNERDSRLIHI